MATFGTQVLTDEVLADLQPTLTSTTIVAFRPKDLRRGGTVPMPAFEQPPVTAETSDADLFDARVLAASTDIATERISRSGTDKITKGAIFGDETPAGAQPVLGKKKPTDSFTLNPEFAQRVFESQQIEIIDPATGDHLAFIRAVLYRDIEGRIAKVQCFLKKGEYLSSDGGKVEFVIGGERYRVRDGFYVTPRGAASGEWCYLGYVG